MTAGVRPRHLILPIVLAVIAAAAWLAVTGRIDQVSRMLGLPALTQTPHEAYARSLRRAGLAETPLARQWFTAAERALTAPTDVTMPRREAVWLPAAQPRAIGLRSALRRGQRLVIEAEIDAAAPVRIFLDLFEETGDGLDHVAHAAADQRSLAIEVPRDGRYVLRAQPELLEDARVTLAWRTEPTLRVPVEGAGRPDIQSFFLAPRDGGQRDHHGVDIFARRGTPVVAAAGGIVTSVGSNTLGGNVVWVVRPLRGERHYYAHLDDWTEGLAVGDVVWPGDPLGVVGDTGNARGTPPHLHYGIYGPDGALDPLPLLRAGEQAVPQPR
jgi:murein DD-endopeptidase MepM/ murein hydrolase activator NlpD